MYSCHTHLSFCEFVDGERSLRIAFVTSSIVRVSYIEGRAFVDAESQIVTANSDFEEFEVSEEETFYRIVTAALEVRVSKSSGALSYLDKEGKVLHKEPERGGRTLVSKPLYRNVYDKDATVVIGSNVDGARAESEASEREFVRDVFEAKIEFCFSDDEAIFGLGSHEEGYGNLRGKSQQLYQQNMKAVVPCVVSTKGYGLLWDCSSLMVFHDDAQGSFVWADCVDQIDTYFIGGGDASAVARNYYSLTGAPPMLPRAAFGYTQSKERYVNPEEMLEVAREYRRREIPLDTIVLDWKSWPDGAGWGQKSFDPARFPNPAAFIEELHSLNVKLMVSIWPIMSGECANQVELREQGLMLGNQSTYNAYDAEARRVYWEQAREGLFKNGVDAWWCDCTEPLEADWEGIVKPESHLRLFTNTEKAKQYIDEDKLLTYSLHHSEGIYSGQRATTNDKRVFNLTRSSYAGQHRYSTVTWSGDICATWEVYRRSIPEGVNFCATGEPYWTVDIGAFFIKNDPECWFWSGDYEDGCRGLAPQSGTEPDPADTGCTDLGYWELYTRWLQYGCFLPMFRSHGTDAPREIWRFGEEGERFYDVIAKYIRLRYEFLPYIYSVSAGVADSGLALLRPVAMQFPKDRRTFDLTDQYLFGPSLMVCPVIQPMYYDRGSRVIEDVDKSRSVYLPEGEGWYDYWTGKFNNGGQEIVSNAPLETIPLYVPAGSILLKGKSLQHANDQLAAPLEIHIYAGADTSFVWYEDFGDGYAYEEGECSRVTMNWVEDSQKLSLSKREGVFGGLHSSRSIIVKIYRQTGVEDRAIEYHGDALEL
ncbi:glycoside hydrolase family 31 protein [Puniceicoccaceae bacterium K14]|nr:glycoside hydrolase family 31 protein [Puniceicoccaceae bacterium K14]